MAVVASKAQMGVIDELMPTDDDLLYEEELLRNPYALKMWVRYISARTDAAVKRRYLLYERALKALPGSYKVRRGSGRVGCGARMARDAAVGGAACRAWPAPAAAATVHRGLFGVGSIACSARGPPASPSRQNRSLGLCLLPPGRRCMPSRCRCTASPRHPPDTTHIFLAPCFPSFLLQLWKAYLDERRLAVRGLRPDHPSRMALQHTYERALVGGLRAACTVCMLGMVLWSALHVVVRAWCLCEADM